MGRKAEAQAATKTEVVNTTPLLLEQALDGRQLALDLARPPQLSVRPFRAELTLEQQSLFVSDTYQGKFLERELIVRDTSGKQLVTRLTVGKAHPREQGRGVLRHAHQDVLYKLYELWGKLGYPVSVVDGVEMGTIRMTVYGLVSALYPGDDSARAYRRASALLQDLKAIPIVLENVTSWQGLINREKFEIIYGLEWSERKVDPVTRVPSSDGTSTVTIRFHTFITEAFRRDYTRILLAKPYESLSAPGRKSGIANLLYPWLQEELFTRDRFEVELKAVAERFMFQQHAQRSKRKEQFKSAVRLLNGLLILEGKYRLHVELVELPHDYLLSASRRPVASEPQAVGAVRGKTKAS